MPGQEISLPSDEIRESFLGYLAGLIRADLHAALIRIMVMTAIDFCG